MKAEKIQPISSSRIVAPSKKSLKPRKLPNSVGIDSDYYFSSKPVKRTTVRYSIEDEEKMKLMNDAERNCYEAYLILTGNYTTL